MQGNMQGNTGVESWGNPVILKDTNDVHIWIAHYLFFSNSLFLITELVLLVITGNCPTLSLFHKECENRQPDQAFFTTVVSHNSVDLISSIFEKNWL